MEAGIGPLKSKDRGSSEARVSREGGQKSTGERLASVLEGHQE